MDEIPKEVGTDGEPKPEPWDPLTGIDQGDKEDQYRSD